MRFESEFIRLHNRSARVTYEKCLRVLATTLAAGMLSLPAMSNAQVGHQPSQSPYEDLKPTQDLTLFAGHLSSDIGAAGILPKSSLFAGIRYDIGLGGPAFLTARYMFAPSERSVVQPANPASTRLLGTTKSVTHEADVGLSIALTGRKTYRRFVPTLSGGIGLVTSPSKADAGEYKFGTKFTVNYGFNLRYVFRNGMALRGEATNFLWQHRYPDSYLIPASDMTAVLQTIDQRTGWNSHWGLSLGAVVPIFR